MVDLTSNREMRDVGPVAALVKDHEAKDGLKNAIPKTPGANSSATLAGQQNVVIGGDGKGFVQAVVVNQAGTPDPTPTASKAPKVAAGQGTVNNKPVSAVGASPTAAVSAAPQAAIGRQPGRGVAARPVGIPAASPRPGAIAQQQTAQAARADETGPRAAGPKAGPREPTGGQLKTEVISVAVDLKETRREAILHQMAGGNVVESPQPHAGRRMDQALRGQQPPFGGDTASATASKLDNGAPQIEASGLIADGAAPKADTAPKAAAKQVAKPAYAGVIGAPNPLRQ